MAKCNPVFIVTLPSEKVRDEAGGRGGGGGRWGEGGGRREVGGGGGRREVGGKGEREGRA